MKAWGVRGNRKAGLLMKEKFESVNQEKQQQMNRTLVMNLLRKKRLCSRAELAKLTGLKRATITNIINDFIQHDYVIEDGILEGEKGRRCIGIRINGEKYRILGIMITRQYYSIGIMGLSGEVYEERKYYLDARQNAHETMEDIKQKSRQMLEEYKHTDVLAIGIAVPGPYRVEDGEVLYITNLIGWDGVMLAKDMKEEFDIPVYVENDANCGAYAQLWFREEELYKNDIIYIIAGQGVGCGIISKGELLKGNMGLAGEIGHTSINFEGPKCECGNRGCLEKYCSTIAVMEKVQKRIANGEYTMLKSGCSFEDFKNAVRCGDKLALEEYRMACEFLAIGVVNIINHLNPEYVIIGDALAEVESQLMRRVVNNKVKEHIRPVIWEKTQIKMNDLEYNPILIGAGVVAAQKVFENPFQFIKE